MSLLSRRRFVAGSPVLGAMALAKPAGTKPAGGRRLSEELLLARADEVFRVNFGVAAIK